MCPRLWFLKNKRMYGNTKGSYNGKMLRGISHNNRQLASVAVLFRPYHSKRILRDPGAATLGLQGCSERRIYMTSWIGFRLHRTAGHYFSDMLL